MSLKEMVNHPEAIIVDVRETWEFGMGHVEGSTNIPLGSVYSQIEMFRNMKKPIIMVCASGNRSGQAAALLSAQGVEQVSNGGSWQDVGYLKLQSSLRAR